MPDPTTARARLEAEQRDTESLLASLARDFSGIVEASRDSNADDEHDPEGATIAFERSQVSTMVDRTGRHLDEIRSALTRLDDGTYGDCTVCGRTIPEERLDARPAARTCVACA